MITSGEAVQNVAIPWAALIALGSAVAAIVTALWAKIRQIERARDEWAERWAAEVKRNQDPPDWEERTDIRHKREELMKEHEAEKSRRFDEERRIREEVDARLRAYTDGESTPPKLRRGK